MYSYINFPYFIISFALGLFLVYIHGEDVKVIKVYPNPSNVETILYKDSSNSCFKMKPQEVRCPSDISKLFNIPFQ
jgi:hypothetical protein